MKPRGQINPSSKSLPKLLLGLGVAAALLGLGGADVARRARDGHGHLNALARRLYHGLPNGLRVGLGGSPALAAAAQPAERADGPLVVYGDKLGDGWSDWSWCTRQLDSSAPTHGGRAAIRMTPENWKGLLLHHDSFNTGGYGTLQLFVSGDPGSLVVALPGGGSDWGPRVPLARFCRPDGNGWSVARIPLAALGVPPSGTTISGVVFQTASAKSYPPVSLDDISLLPDMTLRPAPTQATVPVTVTVAAGRHPISPYIYGMAFAPPDYVADLRLGLNRWGGNDKSRYNWVQGNAVNAARDWGFRNRYASDGSVPPGPSSAADRFVAANKAAGAATLLTVPTLGWVARDADNGHQSQNVPNGGGSPVGGVDGGIQGYDPAANRAATSVRSVARKPAPFADAPDPAGDVVYQDEWVHHLGRTFGDADHGGVRFYAMDNEPDLWDATQTDVHPARMGYDDVLKNFLDYGTAIKAVDPAALVTGPVSWGLTGFNYSALDRGDDNFHTHADQSRHGGVKFLPWFLRQVRAHDLRTGRRTLDVLDVHYYPAGQGVYSSAADKSTQALRMRQTRSLWDPSYADESWIGKPVDLIPMLQGWIAEDYPGTRLGITEWNFGADGDIGGALAIADVLGIYGRENVFLANYWAYPTKNSPGYLAFKLFRSPDGHGGGFGDVACAATSGDQPRLSCYAATDSRTGDLTLLLVNKMAKATVTAPLSLPGFAPSGPVKMWRLAADNAPGGHAQAGARISAFPPRPLPKALTLPPQSVTLVRVPGRR